MATWSKAIKSINWRNVARNTLYLYCTTYVFTKHVGELIVCKGVSMLPTINDGDIIFGERRSVKRAEIKNGDIVCTTDPFNHHNLFCKRVVHEQLEQIQYEQRYPTPLIRVPPGHCFLIGDNMSVSNDSRQFGPVPLGLVQVRLVFRIWPLNRIGWIYSESNG